MLLIYTNRKLHTRFRVLPKSMTLDDLERRLITQAASKHMRLSKPTTKICKLWHHVDTLRRFCLKTFHHFNRLIRELIRCKACFATSCKKRSVVCLSDGVDMHCKLCTTVLNSAAYSSSHCLPANKFHRTAYDQPCPLLRFVIQFMKK